MKIALVNKYLYPKGGGAISTLQMAQLLRHRGHGVALMGMEPAEGVALEFPRYLVSHVDYFGPLTLREKVKAAARLLYSFEAKGKMLELIEKERPHLIHFNSIYHQLSPSIIDAAAARGIPTVMTLRAYKVTCAIYCHLRDAKICEECRGGRFLNAARYRCTRGSLAMSLLNTVEMYLHHQVLNVHGKVGLFISPSRFLKHKVEELGFKGDIVHLSNSVDVDQFQPRYDWDARQIAYFGRLSPEKGLLTLLNAVKGLDVELRIVGAGPMKEELERKASAEGIDNVRFDGFLAGDELRRAIGACMFTVLASECYENNPRSVIESFALGKPVIGSRMGGIPELIAEGRGFCFKAGDALELRERIVTLANDADAIKAIGHNARRYAETHLNEQIFYQKLMQIYRDKLGVKERTT